MIEPPIIFFDRVAVPVPHHHVQRDESDEAVEVQDLFQARQSPGGIGFGCRGDEDFQVRLVFRIFAITSLRFFKDQMSAISISLVVGASSDRSQDKGFGRHLFNEGLTMNTKSRSII